MELDSSERMEGETKLLMELDRSERMEAEAKLLMELDRSERMEAEVVGARVGAPEAWVTQAWVAPVAAAQGSAATAAMAAAAEARGAAATAVALDWVAGGLADRAAVVAAQGGLEETVAVQQSTPTCHQTRTHRAWAMAGTEQTVDPCV